MKAFKLIGNNISCYIYNITQVHLCNSPYGASPVYIYKLILYIEVHSHYYGDTINQKR